MKDINNNIQDEALLGYEDFGEGEIYYTGILPEELQLQMIRKDKDSIMYISNPTRKVLEEVYEDKLEQFLQEMEVANMVPEEYQYLNNAAEDVQIAEVSKDGFLIKYIDNPSEAVQLASLEDSYFSTSRIKNPTEKVTKVALMKSFHNMEHLRFVIPVEKFNVMMQEILSNPRIRKKYVIEFLESYFITGDYLEFIHRYGSTKAKKIAMEFALERGL